MASIALKKNRNETATGPGRDRVDLESLQGGVVADFVQGHDMGQSGVEPGMGGLEEIRRLRQRAFLRLTANSLAFADHRGDRGLCFIDQPTLI